MEKTFASRSKKARKAKSTQDPNKNVDDFFQELRDNVQQGDKSILESLDQLDILDKEEGGIDLLASFREGDETLLHLAAKYQDGTKVMQKIIELCPDLLLVSRKGQHEGQLPLHIVITKQNMEAVKLFLKRKDKEKMLNVQATGSHFINTVMMGELPFSTAALTLDPDIMKVMFKYMDRRLNQVSLLNSYGDTVFHSLVKYSCLHPDKSDEIIEVFKMINQQLSEHPSHEVPLHSIKYLELDQTDPMAMWFQPNFANKTPLQLAASLDDVPVKIFHFIIDIDQVYRNLDRHDGLFDVHLYDITEIDPVALEKFTTSHNRKKGKKSQIYPQKNVEDLPTVNEDKTRFVRFGPSQTLSTKSVLEATCEINIQKAFEILNLKIIRVIIQKKWKRYRWIYFLWAVFHFIFMGLLTWTAIVKAENRTKQSQNTTTNNNVVSTNFMFPCVMSGINMLLALIIAMFEIKRKYQGKRFHFQRVHHNGVYRLVLCLFSVGLMGDGIWYFISFATSTFPENDYFLILALLTGFWFFTFFLRAFQKFSFFTVMLQKILVGDAFRFTVIILLEYISFTVIMYMVFLSTRPEGFESIGNTFLTMFNLMLGLTELGVLTQASEPWLAVVLFIFFIVLTYVLMFNALIAMMSNTCNTVSQNRFIQGKLQKLSVLLFLEDLLPSKGRVCCGVSKIIKRYDLQVQKVIEEERYFLEMDSLQTEFSQGYKDLCHDNLIRTIPLDTTIFSPRTMRERIETRLKPISRKQKRKKAKKSDFLNPEPDISTVIYN